MTYKLAAIDLDGTLLAQWNARASAVGNAAGVRRSCS